MGASAGSKAKKGGIQKAASLPPPPPPLREVIPPAKLKSVKNDGKGAKEDLGLSEQEQIDLGNARSARQSQ